MNPYSHIVVASKLELLANPDDAREYYWGAIAPDIRYLASIQRKQTHIPIKSIAGFISEYPQLKSFLLGYLVHCLADEIELERVFFQHFPFYLFKRKISRQQVSVLLELYYFDNEKVIKPLANSHNEVLQELGLDEATSTKFSQSISQYAILSSPESRFEDLSRLLGMENDSRIDKYLSAAKSFQRNQLLKNILFSAIRTSKISEQIISMVTTLYRHCGV